MFTKFSEFTKESVFSISVSLIKIFSVVTHYSSLKLKVHFCNQHKMSSVLLSNSNPAHFSHVILFQSIYKKCSSAASVNGLSLS